MLAKCALVPDRAGQARVGKHWHIGSRFNKVLETRNKVRRWCVGARPLSKPFLTCWDFALAFHILTKAVAVQEDHTPLSDRDDTVAGMYTPRTS